MIERRFNTLAWLVALLPLVAAHAAYLISASHGLVPWCIPHLEGCTSISRAARVDPTSILVYKSLLLPYSALLVLFWRQAALGLREVAPGHPRTQRALLPVGIVAGVATATYTAVLGTDGEVQQWIRRYAINVGFGFSVLAQMLFAAAIAGAVRVPRALRRALVGLCAAMIALGVASIPLQFLMESRDAAINAIEWTVGVLMVAAYPLIGAAVRSSAPA